MSIAIATGGFLEIFFILGGVPIKSPEEFPIVFS